MYDETKGDEIDLAGSLLLAHPHLTDPNFSRSVVLLTAHGADGSLGVVLNRSSGRRLRQLDESFEGFGLGDVPVYLGGPVGQDQIILAAWKTLETAGEFRLYFGLEPLIAQSKMQIDPDLEFRAFQGYAGWGEAQLLGELEDNAWVVADMDARAVSERSGEALWLHLISKTNPELGLLSLEPDEPEAN